MTVEQWMQDNGKSPWHGDGHDYPFWYWGTMDRYDPEGQDGQDDIDFLLPEGVFDRLKAKTTYPNVKVYWTKQEALDDLAQALIAP